MNVRVISAIVAIPVLIFFVISGGYIFNIGIGIISAIAIYEYTNVYKASKNNVVWPILVLGFMITYILIYFDLTKYNMMVIYLVVLLSMATPIFLEKYNVISSAITAIGYIYIVNFFALMIDIRAGEFGHSFIWIIIIISFACDTFAYYTGKLFGKHKLCPKVSPKKTVEGSIGGIIGSLIGVSIWGYLNADIRFSWVSIIILAIVASIVSQIGDLSASLIKRYCDVKDYGKIMPGHGGILDRFDSILFTTPIVYCYIVFFIR